MSDTEARDVLAEAMATADWYEPVQLARVPDRVREHYRRNADAGLAALREHGFAVVRTADVADDIAWTIRDLTEDGMDPREIANAVLARIQEAIR